MIKSFFLNPVSEVPINSSFTSKVRELLIVFIIFFFISGLFNSFIKVLDILIQNETGFSFIKIIKVQQEIGTKRLPLFFILFLGPLMEECIFRLPLKISKLNVSLALSLASLYFIGDKIVDFNILSFYTLIKIIPILFIIYFVYLSKKNLIPVLKKLLDKYYTLYFYSLAIVFGLVHIFNFYKVVPINLLIFSPLFTMSLILLGVFLNYIRIKIGFTWVIFAHSFFNLLIMLFTMK
jgi:hypothetical protein